MFDDLDEVGVANVLYTSDNDFALVDPLSLRSSPLTTNAVVDSGPTDCGALFDFSFDPLVASGTRSFSGY